MEAEESEADNRQTKKVSVFVFTSSKPRAITPVLKPHALYAWLLEMPLLPPVCPEESKHEPDKGRH